MHRCGVAPDSHTTTTNLNGDVPPRVCRYRVNWQGFNKCSWELEEGQCVAGMDVKGTLAHSAFAFALFG